MPNRLTVRKQWEEGAMAHGADESRVMQEGDSLTEQEHKDRTDINHVLRLFGVRDNDPIPATPISPEINDFTNVPDLRTALDQVRTAQETFAQLPAKIRRKFHNRPEELWEYVNDPDNHEEAVKLGILHRAGPDTSAPTAPASGSSGGSPSNQNSPATAASTATAAG